MILVDNILDVVCVVITSTGSEAQYLGVNLGSVIC